MSGLAESIAGALKTTQPDPRYPSHNQANTCWGKYNQWALCVKKSGDEDACKPMRQIAHSICPDDWVEKWDGERDEGNFSGVRP